MLTLSWVVSGSGKPWTHIGGDTDPSSVPFHLETRGWGGQPLKVAHWGLGVRNTLKSPERMSVVRDHGPALNIPGRCGDNQPARHLQDQGGETETEEHYWGHHFSLCIAQTIYQSPDVENSLLIFLQLIYFLSWPYSTQQDTKRNTSMTERQIH